MLYSILGFPFHALDFGNTHGMLLFIYRPGCSTSMKLLKLTGDE